MNEIMELYLGLFLVFNIGFVFYLITNHLKVIDLFWGMGHLYIALMSYYQLNQINSDYKLKPTICTILTIFWAIRLTSYLFIRNINQGEDFRYQKLKDSWKGPIFLNAYFKIFMFQGVVLGITSLTIVFIMKGNIPDKLIWIDYLGIVLFVTGFLWESIADTQLYLFKKKNPNEYYNGGLWKYSRHPNYFGEILLWWGMWVFSISSGYWYYSIFAPIVIHFMILKVSGIPFLKNRFDKSKDQKSYVNKKNALIPKFF